MIFTTEKGKTLKAEASETGKIIQAESSEKGAVGVQTYKTYFKALGGYICTGLVMLLFLVPILCVAFNNWWLSYWLKNSAQVRGA